MNFRSKDDKDIDLNLTPLIDVVFLLLIFFMVTTTFDKDSAIKIDLPKASQATPDEKTEVLELVIDEKGHFYIDNHALVNDEATTLRHALQKVLQGRKDVPLVIRADGRTPHQAVVTAMDVAGRLGLKRMSIATHGVEEP